MDDARRTQIEAEILDHAREWLSGAQVNYPEGFDIGTIGLAFDLHFPDGTSGVGYACSDGREWVHAGLFRAAMHEAEAGGGEP
jgi:hypothetical protein